MQDRLSRIERLTDDAQERITCLEAGYSSLAEATGDFRRSIARIATRHDWMLGVAASTLLGVATMLMNHLLGE